MATPKAIALAWWVLSPVCGNFFACLFCLNTTGAWLIRFTAGLFFSSPGFAGSNGRLVATSLCGAWAEVVSVCGRAELWADELWVAEDETTDDCDSGLTLWLTGTDELDWTCDWLELDTADDTTAWLDALDCWVSELDWSENNVLF